MSKRTPTLSKYRPTTGEWLSEVVIEKPTSAVHRLMGASEKDAALRGRDAANNFDQLTGWRSALAAAQRMFNGNVTMQNALTTLPLALPMLGRAASPLVRRASAAAPEAPLVQNSLYGGTIFNPSSPTPQTAGVPQYAFRAVHNPNEIADIQRSGFMRPRKEGGQKYFSVSDSPMGNPANLNSPSPILRVKTDNIPFNSPVSSRHVEIWNPKTKQFMQLPKKTK